MKVSIPAGGRIAARAAALLGAALIAGLVLGAPEAGGRTLPQSVVERAQRAQAAYEEGRFEEALATYRELLEAGWESADLYYNLGCASYRAGRIGWSVAYLEQARRMAPRDPDIRHNLRVATAHQRDRVDREPPSPLLGAMAGLLDGYSPADAVRALLGVFWIGCFLVAALWLVRGRVRTLLRRLLVVVALLGLLVLSGVLLKAYQLATAPSGVVVAEEGRVLSGPREGETVQFVLHEGTLVHLGRAAGPWREIWLTEEMRGWLPEEAVVALRKARWLP